MYTSFLSTRKFGFWI